MATQIPPRTQDTRRQTPPRTSSERGAPAVAPERRPVSVVSGLAGAPLGVGIAEGLAEGLRPIGRGIVRAFSTLSQGFKRLAQRQVTVPEQPARDQIASTAGASPLRLAYAPEPRWSRRPQLLSGVGLDTVAKALTNRDAVQHGSLEASVEVDGLPLPIAGAFRTDTQRDMRLLIGSETTIRLGAPLDPDAYVVGDIYALARERVKTEARATSDSKGRPRPEGKHAAGPDGELTEEHFLTRTWAGSGEGVQDRKSYPPPAQSSGPRSPGAAQVVRDPVVSAESQVFEEQLQDLLEAVGGNRNLVTAVTRLTHQGAAAPLSLLLANPDLTPATLDGERTALMEGTRPTDSETRSQKFLSAVRWDPKKPNEALVRVTLKKWLIPNGALFSSSGATTPLDPARSYRSFDYVLRVTVNPEADPARCITGLELVDNRIHCEAVYRRPRQSPAEWARHAWARMSSPD